MMRADGGMTSFLQRVIPAVASPLTVSEFNELRWVMEVDEEMEVACRSWEIRSLAIVAWLRGNFRWDLEHWIQRIRAEYLGEDLRGKFRDGTEVVHTQANGRNRVAPHPPPSQAKR